MLLIPIAHITAIECVAQYILSECHEHVTSSLSTNSELMEKLLNAGLPATQPAILTADSQSAGRGQHGRSWQSPKGNLYFSFYHPLTTTKATFSANILPLTAPITGLLSLCVGQQLANMSIIRQLNRHRLSQSLPNIGVKWVNDVGFYHAVKTHQSNNMHTSSHFDKVLPCHQSPCHQSPCHQLQFYKLAGILIEPVQRAGKRLGVVIGIGINVQNPPTLTSAQQENMGHQAVGLNSLIDKCNLPNCLPVSFLPVSPQDLYRPVLMACLNALLIHDQLICEPKDNGKDKGKYSDEFLYEFAKVDVLAGKRIKVRSDRLSHFNGDNANDDNTMLTGRVIGIDRHGRLQVADDGGKIHALFTGSIPNAFACDDGR